MSEQKKQVVVIGNGMAGYRFCEKLLEYDAHHQYSMTVLGDDPLPAYDRVALSTLFGSKKERELIFSEKRWYDYYKIDLKLGTRVVSIDRKAKTVKSSTGEDVPYDKLVIATGSRPFVPTIGNSDKGGVFVYRTPQDVAGIRARAEKVKHAVVIGGGLLGLEAAEACREMDLHTTIVEHESVLMFRQLDKIGGYLLDQKIEKLGIHLKLGTSVQSVEGENAAERVILNGGEELEAGLVIIAAGITPNDELGAEADLDMGQFGGIAVNENVLTSDPDIYAVGECASFNDELFGLVAPCYAMAEAAAAHLGKINRVLEKWTPASKLKLLDLHVSSIGETHLSEAEAVHFIDQDIHAGVYKKLLISKDWKKLLGAILIGENSEFERLRKAIAKETLFPANPRDWLAPIGEPLNIEVDLEDDDLVCYCNYVTKGDICRAIDDEKLKNASQVMASTYAASSCGGCLQNVLAVTKQYIEHGI